MFYWRFFISFVFAILAQSSFAQEEAKPVEAELYLLVPQDSAPNAIGTQTSTQTVVVYKQKKLEKPSKLPA